MSQKPNFESKQIRILGEKGINSKVKHRKLTTRFYPGDLVPRTGDREIVVVSGRVGMYETVGPPRLETRLIDNLLPMQPRFQINITPIKLVSKSIYHRIDGILFSSFKFGQRQLKLLKN